MVACNKVITVGLQGTLDSDFYWADGAEFISNQDHIDYIVSVGGVISTADQATFDALPCIIPDGSESVYPQWIYTGISATIITENSSGTLVLDGCYYSPNIVITVDDITVSNFQFICEDTVSFDFDASGASVGVKNVYIDGIGVTTVEIVTNTWIDFRSGGNTVDSGQYELIGITAGQVTRDANGIGVTSGSGWGRALGLPEFSIAANTTTGCQIILYLPTSGAGMFGLFGDGHGTDTTMYNDQHVGGYYTSPTNWWGFFAYASSSNSAVLTGYDRVKLKFPTTLTPGSSYEVWGLTSGDSFGGGTLIYSSTTPSGSQAASTNVYPEIVPNNAISCRLQAFNPLGGV